jgi:pyruvate,orthophosphate dikinase
MPLVFGLDHDHDLPREQLPTLIGGKAANLAVMAAELRLPVPPGFVISTEACRAYLSAGWPEGLDTELRAHMRRTEQLAARRFGGADPLLVSVRSGAPVSMPGMMDTILNLGLNEETSAGLARATGNAGLAQDCSARLRSMFEAVVGREPPRDPWEQLRAAIEAVFRSWNSERARAYRKVERISDELGTAVTVQAMVFGNSGPDSATGVLFTRNPATGERELFGDVLFEAQGEDVVSGARPTLPVAVLRRRMPDVARQLGHYADVLERHYADMCDIEFTIERGRLWLLQVRAGKRSPQAALRMAVEMADDPGFPLTREQAVRRVSSLLAEPPRQWAGLPGSLEPVTTGLPASPGLATGEIVTSPATAQAVREAGRPFILARAQTSPDDVPAMVGAAGLLTSLGGLASHAAVIARGWGVPAVVGATGVEVSEGVIIIGGQRYPEGMTITVDGSTGHVYAGAVTGKLEPSADAARLLAWARQAGAELPSGGGSSRSPAQADSGHRPTVTVLAPGGTTPPQPPAAEQAPRILEDVIRCLSIKGTAPIEVLAAALLTSAEAVQSAVAELTSARTVAVASGSIRLTDAGAARAAALTDADRRSWGADKALKALDGFRRLDEAVKATVTAWQLRDSGGQQVLNDHTDAEYDAGVLADLQTIHSEVSEWFGSHADVSGWLSGYAARLDRAAAAVAGGDHRFVSSPRVDSYHSIWFELHEELIRLAGRTRADEVASGRA